MRRPRLAEFAARNKQREYFSNVKLLTFMFQLLSMGLVLLNSRQSLNVNTLVFTGLLIGLTYLSNVLVMRYTKGDNYLIMIANMLFSIGIVMLYRINPALGQRQLLFYALGIAVFYASYYFLNYTGRFWQNKTFLFLGLSVAMLLVTLVFGRLWEERPTGSVSAMFNSNRLNLPRSPLLSLLPPSMPTTIFFKRNWEAVCF